MSAAMKTSSLILFVLALVTSCDRDHSSTPVASSKHVAQQSKYGIAASMHQSIRAEADSLILSGASSGQLSNEALTKLESMAPRLLEADLLIDVLAAVPLEQMSPFTDLVFEAVKKLAPKAGQIFNPKYEDAIRLAERLDPRKLASLVFDHLVVAPPYEFPAFELPGGWGDATLGVHAWKGTQGFIATTIVQYGDDALMARYRHQLQTATPQLQRVMAWALSRSPDPQDFELLWKLHSTTRDPSLADIVKRAMNVVPRSLEALANDSDAKQINRSGMSPDELKSKAKALRERLQVAKLSTPLTVWD